jgi:hypothetical protein
MSRDLYLISSMIFLHRESHSLISLSVSSRSRVVTYCLHQSQISNDIFKLNAVSQKKENNCFIRKYNFKIAFLDLKR